MARYKEPFQNLDHDEPLSKRELIQEISARTKIRGDVVAEILEKFSEVATEEIVNKGAFSLDGVFTVSSSEHKEVRTPLGVAKAGLRLSIKLSHTVKRLRSIKLKSGESEHESYLELTQRRLNESTSTKPKKELWNPMLDED